MLDDEVATQKTKTNRARRKQVEELMKENEKILGKKTMAKILKEAREMIDAMDEEIAAQMSIQELDERIEYLKSRSKQAMKRYAEKQIIEDAQYMKENADSPEKLELYCLARKVTSSAKVAREMVENNKQQPVIDAYRAYRDRENATQNRNKKIRKQKAAKSASAREVK